MSINKEEDTKSESIEPENPDRGFTFRLRTDTHIDSNCGKAERALAE